MARLRVLLAATALAVGFGGVTHAIAAAPTPIAECNASGALTHHYSAAVLQHALATMPADIKEYTDCYDVIQRALLAQVSGRHAGGSNRDSGGSGGTFLPTPVIVVIVVLAVAAASFGFLALRRRGAAEPRNPDAASGP
jgi:hypothetical protein